MAFEIVDPSRFWIEAVAHDPGVVANLSKAFAVTNSGETLALDFVGLGLSLRQQTVPLTFRVAQAAPNLEHRPAGHGHPAIDRRAEGHRLAGIQRGPRPERPSHRSG